MKTFDVVVIGAGPAGYVAAIRCAQLGFATAVVDKWIGKDGKPALGGTCLNVGCIPSKALLESSEHYDQAIHKLEKHGVRFKNLSFDVPSMIERKDKIVQTLTQGVQFLFKKNKITWIPGAARLESNQQVAVTAHDGKTELVGAKHIIIATGSAPRDVPNVEINGDTIVDAAGALDFQSVPENLVVIGAGVIGLELGSVWKRLGSKVVLLEAMDTFLPAVDEQVAQAALKEFDRQGLDIRLGTRVLSGKLGKKKVSVQYQDANGGTHSFECDKVIVAVGRKPCSDHINAQGAGLLLDERGYVHVDDFCRTNLPNVYAIGDVVRGPMLAHKGQEEGVMVAERLAGEETKINYDAIPWVIYTSPEIAWVGKTERQLKQAAREYKTGVFPLSASGRAKAMEATVGLVKVIADAKTDRILGVHMFSPAASELIMEAVVSMEFAASAEDLQRVVHAHPSIAEALHEAALAVDGRPLHI
ncbi:MAG: dihydrolipoyl dehydrogenase [Kiritimatiellae bacterium]|nr:dihydrolipoyl dehydrogenase [Kiritimatiellia bacterium]